MHPFIYNGQPGRVVFGCGAIQHLEREVDALRAQRALVLCTPEQLPLAEQIADILGGRAGGIFPRAQMHVPIETAREAQAFALRLGADCAIAVGGGSTTGLGKAIALDSGLPILAIPTTYAGSEMTPIYGLTEGGLKKTGRDARVLPKTVIYDPELTTSLPLRISITSAMNAIAHAAEGLYAQDRNPVMSLMAREGIEAMVNAIPALHHNAVDLEARARALYGAWLCGTVLGNVGMALHHKLCHTLGGSFNLPHAEVHTVVLPHALAFNAQYAPKAMEEISRAIHGDIHRSSGGKFAPSALFDLAQTHGAPVALRDIGMQERDLDHATDIAVSNAYSNPRPIGKAQWTQVRLLLQHAFEGHRPDPTDHLN